MNDSMSAAGLPDVVNPSATRSHRTGTENTASRTAFSIVAAETSVEGSSIIEIIAVATLQKNARKC